MSRIIFFSTCFNVLKKVRNNKCRKTTISKDVYKGSNVELFFSAQQNLISQGFRYT